MKTRYFHVVAAAVALAALRAQNPAPAAPASEEFLLLGDANRGAGEPMIAVDPTNPKNIVAVAMGNLNRIGGKVFNGQDEYHATANSTVTWLGVTHDGGDTWKVGELPIVSGKYTRCPDSLVAVTADGTFLAGCEPRETTGDFFGTSSVVVSTDKGETWGKRVDLISSYGAARFAPGLKPRIGGNSPWDRPYLYVDDSTGVIYAQAGGGETDIDTAPGQFRTQGYITASTDKGKSFGTIYSWDNKDYPQTGRGRMTAGHGVAAVVYVARAAPASEGATCPCTVLGISRDQGKTFTYRVLNNVPAGAGRGGARGGQGRGGGVAGSAPGAPDSAAQGIARGPVPGGGRGGGVQGFAADPTKAGRFALLVGAGAELRMTVSDDYGATWSPMVTAGQTPNAASLTKPWMEYSRKGVLALMWRAIYADRTYDIWSSLSKDGGKTFSAAMRVSHAVSPASIPGREAGRFGDDLQNLALDDQNVYMVWADSRSGFQGVWFGRVPLSAY